MSEIFCKPLNDNIIWICYGYDISIWKIINEKAEYFGCWRYRQFEDLDYIVSASKLDIMLCKVENSNRKLQFSSKCQPFKCKNGYFTQEGCILKARKTAADPDLALPDAVNFLHKRMTLKFKGQELTSFHEHQQLPINYTQKLNRATNEDEFQISSYEKCIDRFSLPNYDKDVLTFKVDTNGIYHVSFSKSSTTVNPYTYLKRKIFAPLASSMTLTPGNKHSNEVSYDWNVYSIPKKEILLNSNFQAIGIDLGTSRCCAAVNRKNGITTIPLDNKGERLLPSYVAYNEKNPTFGQVAVNRLRQYSKSTIFDSKRIIGRKFNDIEIDSNWNFTVNCVNDQVYMEVSGFNGKKRITAEEVAADLLKHVKQKAEDFQGTKLSYVVITIPAAFTEPQKSATMRAARLAGWNQIALLPEPIAAAFAYFIDRPLSNESNILLFDLGGGTLDVCIFQIENNQITIVANTGDSKFGGRDFDTVLINYFKNALSAKHGNSTLKDKKYRLMLECQRIKEDLSAVMECSLDINDFDVSKDGTISISRNKFQRMTQTLLNKVKNTIYAALFQSNFQPTQINKVLLVGGGSRMPMVKNLLKELFPQAEHCCEEHPDEVVAIGAAYYAYSIFSE